jgi:hypothetical protein
MYREDIVDNDVDSQGDRIQLTHVPQAQIHDAPLRSDFDCREMCILGTWSRTLNDLSETCRLNRCDSKVFFVKDAISNI